MNTTDFMRMVDHAAAMNDRWLFLAAFCLLLIGCEIVIYWLVRRLEGVISDHRQARDTQNETALKLAVCIERNTATMQECTDELRRYRERK